MNLFAAIVSVILLFLLLLEIINVISFRYFCAQINGRARLEILRHADDTMTMNYLCPGLLGRARPSFNFILAKLYGGITLIDYNNAGVKPQAVAQQILDDIKAHGYHGVVITISYGEQIARHLNNHGGSIDVISINPCTDSDALRFSTSVWLSLLLPLAKLFNFLLGWASYQPLIPTVGPKYSTSLILSQLNTIVHSKNNDEDYPEAWGLVLSNHDELLDNETLSAKYGFLPPPNVEFVNTRHASTISQGSLYRDALEPLLFEIY